MIKCSNCATDNSADAVVCVSCGTRLDMPQERPATASKRLSASQLISAAKVTKARYDNDSIRASRNFTDAVTEIDAIYVESIRRTRSLYDDAISGMQAGLSSIAANLGLSAADWTSGLWDRYVPSTDGSLSVGLRFGSATFRTHFGEFVSPAILPILNQGNLFFVAKGASKKTAVDAVQSLLLRAVATFKPGKLKLSLFDPVGLGANVAGLMNLPEQVIGSKAWTETQQIEQQLANLSTHMENVIQKYLRNDYKSMEDYNRQAGEVAEPYRFLGVINFPVNFSDSAAKRLISLAANGPRAGVYVICSIDADLPLPYGFNVADLLRTGSVVESTGSNDFVWQVAGLNKLRISLDSPPPPERFNAIVQPISDVASRGERVEVPFEKLMPTLSDWWKGSSSINIEAPIGRRGAREIQLFELGQGTQHYALMAGKPGSGKSTLLHVLITNLAMKYSPEELVLYLVDFKKGVEFKDYAVFRLPHARVIGIESEREFGLSVLREIQQEMNRRGDLFRNANHQDIHSYRTMTGERLPRVLLIIDEFQRLFSEDDPLAGQAANILSHIVQQGRAFGIHTLLASQTLADAHAVGRATYDKMNVRIALQCTEADSRLILGEDNSAARLLSRPGEGVYNALNGREEGNKFFQVTWLSDDKREGYLRQIQDFSARQLTQPTLSQVVFEGNVPARSTTNVALWSAIASPDWPLARNTVEVYLGESTEINPPHTLVKLRQQGRSSILILGQNEKTAMSLISTVWLSIGALQHPGAVEFFVVDFSRVDDPWGATLRTMKECLPHQTAFARPRDFVETLANVHAILKQRILAGQAGSRKTFLIINGLHRARELRETDKYGSQGEAYQSLATICREGPDLGVHVIAWCDTYGNLTRSVDRKMISEFDIRIALQMADDESNQFIETSKAKSLGPNRAYLSDMDRVGALEKFRPYELLDDTELSRIKLAFAGKKGN